VSAFLFCLFVKSPAGGDPLQRSDAVNLR